MTNELGHAIRDHRNNLGLSLRGFAEVSGVSHSYLGKIERGESIPPQPTLNRIINSLHLKDEEAKKLHTMYMMEIGYDLSLTQAAITRVKESDDRQYCLKEPRKVFRIKTFKEEVLDLLLKSEDENLSYKQAELLASELYDFYKVRLNSIKGTGGED